MNGKNVGYKRIFGGQVMAQTLIAAYKTVNVEHFAHSFHSYFIRPGNMEKPITFTAVSYTHLTLPTTPYV